MVRTILRRAALTVAATATAFVCAEGALRVAGFSFRTYPTVQFGYPEPTAIRDLFQPDRDLFWVTRGYGGTLDSARHTHPAIVFMGDSCTQFGTYPEMTLARLASVDPPLASGINVAVVGWSSEQGLAQFRRDIIPLRPRVVTVYYGWNDHWVALGPTDADARATAASFWLSQHSRVWQLATKARLAASPPLAGRPDRVSLDRYVTNLETIVREGSAAGIAVVLITAPSGHEQGHEPEYLARRHIRRIDELVPLHARYVEGTRRAGRDTGATVCDAAAAFDADPQRGSYFEVDGIHLKRPGNRAMADLLVRCVERAAASSGLRAAQ